MVAGGVAAGAAALAAISGSPGAGSRARGARRCGVPCHTGVSGSDSARLERVERLLRMPLDGSTAPALVEAMGGGRFVLKLRGAAVGCRTLAIEYVATEIGRGLGLSLPAARPLHLSAEIAARERHAELSELLHKSVGTNLGFEYLPGAEELPRYTVPRVSSDFASMVVCFDALLVNVDRTARNPNVLFVGGDPWLIDHGSCRAFDDASTAFPALRDHLLLHRADDLEAALRRARQLLSRRAIDRAFAQVPAEWWEGSPPADLLHARLEAGPTWLEELERFRREPPPAIGPPPDRRPAWARRPPGQ